MTSKQQTLMYRGLTQTGAFVEWFYESLNDLGNARNIVIPCEDWDEMGRPNIITVTIEPGDLLNDEPS